MDSDQHTMLKDMLEEIPPALTSPNDHGISETIATGPPTFWGDHVRVPIDPSLSYGVVQGIAPPWLTVLKVENGMAYVTIDPDHIDTTRTD